MGKGDRVELCRREQQTQITVKWEMEEWCSWKDATKETTAVQKETLRPIPSVLVKIWMFHKASGKQFYGHMELKLNFLAQMFNAIFGGKRTLHTNTKTSSQLYSMGKGTSWYGHALLTQGLRAGFN